MTRRDAEDLIRLLDALGEKAVMTQDGTDIGVMYYPRGREQVAIYDWEHGERVVDQARQGQALA